VFPVLVAGAQMPAPQQLPDDIRQLARQYAIEVTDSRWEYDTDRLSKAVANTLRVAPKRAPVGTQHTR
jgi:hypothetical protein